MRSTTFARIVCAISICGLAINSSCAPDSKRRTPVNRSGGGGGAGGAGGLAPKIASVSKTMDPVKCANGVPQAVELSELQSRIDALNNLGTPIKFPALPKGQYRLIKATTNLVANNIPEVGTFALYREATVTLSGTKVNEHCSDFAVVGKLPATPNAKDEGRSQNIDTFFEIGPQGLASAPLVASYRFQVGNPPVNSQIGIYTIEKAEEKAQLAERAQKRLENARRRNAPVNTAKAPKLYSLIKELSKNANGKILDATNQGQFDATGDVQLFKVSESEYAIAITYQENLQSNVVTDRKIILTYGFVSTDPTVGAGTQNAPTKMNAPHDAATSTDTTPAAPAPITNAPAASTNPQAPMSQQEQDLLKKQADEAAAALANPAPGAPTAPSTPNGIDPDAAN